MHLFQVGAGSGGIVVLDLICRDSRISGITLVEPDVYSHQNVHRHLFPNPAVGRLKADVAAEWVYQRRPDLRINTIIADLTDPARAGEFGAASAAGDIGICAVDNEPAKYAFDALLRAAGKPWTLGEVLSGGIGGWPPVRPGGACYGRRQPPAAQRHGGAPCLPTTPRRGPVPEHHLPRGRVSH